MALEASVGSITYPGATGNQTISLPSGFGTPKALILWCSRGITAGTSAAHGSWSMGFATYRGSVVGQRCVSTMDEDAIGSADCYRAQYSDRLAQLISTTGTISMRVDFVSFGTDQFVINWVTGLANTKLNYLVLGGSDITDALVGTFALSVGASTQDVTVASGFGQPDLVFAMANGNTIANGIVADSTSMFGFGIKGERGRCVLLGGVDGAALALDNGVIFNNEIGTFYDASSDTQEWLGHLQTVTANWPTDGFEMEYTNTPAFGDDVSYLAIKGTFTKTTGESTNPTSGVAPQTVNLDHGSPPKCMLALFANLITANTLDSTSTRLGYMGVGALDTVPNEVYAGWTTDDGPTTMDANSIWDNTKCGAIRTAANGVVTLVDGSISGNNVVTSWTITDPTARMFEWLTLGDAPAAATFAPPPDTPRRLQRQLLCR